MRRSLKTLFGMAVFVFSLVLPKILVAEQNIFVLPPVAVTTEKIPPGKDLQKIIVDFRNSYKKEVDAFLENKEPIGFWVLTTVLVPECKDYKGWCIVVGAIKEKKGAKPISIIRIPIVDKTSFDSASEAKKALEATKKVIPVKSFGILL